MSYQIFIIPLVIFLATASDTNNECTLEIDSSAIGLNSRLYPFKIQEYDGSDIPISTQANANDVLTLTDVNQGTVFHSVTGLPVGLPLPAKLVNGKTGKYVELKIVQSDNNIDQESLELIGCDGVPKERNRIVVATLLRLIPNTLHELRHRKWSVVTECLKWLDSVISKGEYEDTLTDSKVKDWKGRGKIVTQIFKDFKDAQAAKAKSKAFVKQLFEKKTAEQKKTDPREEQKRMDNQTDEIIQALIKGDQ
eukprot:264643_1